jgi:molybdopterin molybdotransferase
MRGCRSLLRPRITARLTESLKKPSGRLHLVRVALEQDPNGWAARPTGPQGSHIQSSLLEADGVALFEREETFLEAGVEVTVEVWRLPG